MMTFVLHFKWMEGYRELVKVEDENIYVRLVGACSTCPSSVMTMRMGVENLLNEEFPSLKG